VKERSVKRVFVFGVSIALLLLFVPSGAGRAGESRPGWKVEWDKTLKAAEAEGEGRGLRGKIGVRELLLMALMKKCSDPDFLRSFVLLTPAF
jgi:hypothetical protein